MVVATHTLDSDPVSQFRAAMIDVGINPPETIEADGQIHRFPTGGKPGDAAGWYVLHLDGVPAGAFGDWRTGVKENWSANPQRRTTAKERAELQKCIDSSRLSRKAEEALRYKAVRESAARIWHAAVPVRHTLVEVYLRGRGILESAPSSLRFHGTLTHPAGDVWPAMVALVTHWGDGEPLAIHRTFLARDGRAKAPVVPQKMMLGPCRGGVVRLAPAKDALMVGEGIETCFSAMQVTGVPTWAALSTSGLRTLELPDHIKEVVVLADADAPGEAAACSAAQRWARPGRRVRVARPPQGMDFNDLLLKRVRRYPENCSWTT